jgi:hypothetical protein
MVEAQFLLGVRRNDRDGMADACSLLTCVCEWEGRDDVDQICHNG